jgi:hypothetical protein
MVVPFDQDFSLEVMSSAKGSVQNEPSAAADESKEPALEPSAEAAARIATKVATELALLHFVSYMKVYKRGGFISLRTVFNSKEYMISVVEKEVTSKCGEPFVAEAINIAKKTWIQENVSHNLTSNGTFPWGDVSYDEYD